MKAWGTYLEDKGSPVSERQSDKKDLLDDGDEQLDVAKVVEDVEPDDGVNNTEDEGDDNEDGDGGEDPEADLGDLLATPVVDEALDDVESTGEDRVDGEEDVVGLDGNNPPRMSVEVLLLEDKSDMEVLLLEDRQEE